ncbi:MAG: ATP-binding protein [Bacteroidetes Order II. Incertae sedis bacterium]|jgi:predicted HTH transcriptional regulator|nr:ATP-binding protein [Bacteroidetes Order II. bacterium]MDG1754983.1 ATP-binding protein [Rhodothermales bacterium]HAY35848.1 ATP-binding protein [Bacteroidota bacterium]MBT4051654.1 ATP-binding protein [Bacteroidetes Order II. bacterium]MBT4601616.1 ATP-binding protein [Bacteroidetes Order II. bacterium]
MTLEEARRIVAKGEGLYTEFKTRVPSPDRLAREVIAFANTNGGRVFIGVDDEGGIIGVKDSFEEEFAIQEAVGLYCRPAIKWRSERIPVTNKRDVILVTVPKSKRKPHFIVQNDEDGSGPALVRIEDSSVEASPESVALMQTEYDPDGVHFEFGEKELLLMRYLEQYGKISVQGFAQIADMERDEAGKLLVTLTRARVLVQNREVRGDYFTIAY